MSFIEWVVRLQMDGWNYIDKRVVYNSHFSIIQSWKIVEILIIYPLLMYIQTQIRTCDSVLFNLLVKVRVLE